MKFKDKSEIVNKLIRIMEKSELNSEQKKRIVKVVKNLEMATEIQKERFILFYGLDDNGSKIRTLKQIAEKYNCTTNAIRVSVVTVKNKLSRLEKNVKIIENIVQECENNK